MVLVGSILGLFFLAIKVAAENDLAGLADPELRSIIKSKGRDCNGCDRGKLLKLASDLSMGSTPGRQNGANPSKNAENTDETTFDEIQNILDELREKIKSDAKPQQADVQRPNPGEQEAMAKELREEFLNAFKSAAVPKSGRSSEAIHNSEGDLPLEKLSEKDPRFKGHKAMSGGHQNDGKPRESRKSEKEVLQSGDYLEIAKTLGKKYFGILRVNLEYYSQVGAALGKQYGFLSMDYASRFMKSAFHYSKVYGGLTFRESAKFAKYTYRKARGAGNRLWTKLTNK